MRLFSEEVTPTFTNSNLNIITVKDFSEIFFDVYELEINGKKYITEKIDDYKGSPVVSLTVENEGKEYTAPFILNKGSFSLLFNKANCNYVKDTSECIEEVIVENNIIDEVETIIFEKHENILEDINQAKVSAKNYFNKLKQKQKQEASDINRQKLVEFNNELKEIQQGLVEEFVRVVSNVRSDISLANDNTSEKLKKFITGKVTILAESLENNLENKVEELETYINERVNSIASDIVSGVIATEIKSSNTRLDENIDGLFNHINLKLTELVKEHEVLTSEKVNSILSTVDDKLVAIDQVSIELNNSIQKSSNKALSRIGNVKIHLEENIAKNVTILQHDIDKASERIKVYYDAELNKLNEAVNNLSDETKQECIKLISESRDSLLQVISEIKTDVPNIIIEKKDGTGKEIDLKKVKSELEKSITTRFSTELMSLKRMMEMMSGGGSVAKQFADGGTMNGNLTVVGAISASQYLGIPGGGGGVSGDYLPLSGGTVTGALVVQDGFTSNGDEALFTGINFTVENTNTVIDSTNSLSVTTPTVTFNATSGVSINGNLSASGIVTSPDYTVTGVSGAELSISKSVTTWEFGTAAVSVNTQATTPLGVDFNDTGTKAFVVNATTGALNVFQYNLSTPWTLGTATYSTIFKSVSGADSVPRGIKFSIDGLYMFIVGDTNNSIYRYTLTAPWDLNTVSINPTQTLSLVPLVGTLTAPQGVDFSLDGRKMYVANSFNNLIFEFNLVNPWVLTGATYSGNSLNVNAFTGESNLQDVVISSDGTRLITIGSITERVWEFTLPTPYSLVGAFLHGFMRVSFNGNSNFNMLPIAAFSEGNVSGLYYNDVSNKCFYVGDDTNAIQEIIVKPQILLIGERPIIRATGADLGAGVGAGSVRINRLRITDTTGATSNDGGTYGALTVAGGIGAANITVAGSIVGGNLRVDGANTIVFNTRSTIASNGFGIITIGTAPTLNDFNMLQLGPQGVSYPAIKRNATGVDIVRSDQTTANSTPISGFTDLRARNLTAFGTLCGTNVAINGTSLIDSNSDGIIKISNSANTNFNLLQLGGIDVNFPAIKRNGSGLDIVNAADTVGGFTDLRARNITLSGGDLEIGATINGVILKSPNGTRYRITVDNSGALITTTVV